MPTTFRDLHQRSNPFILANAWDAGSAKMLEAEHIATMPGESFGTSAAGHLRVAMTVDDAAFREALERLVAFAKGLAT